MIIKITRKERRPNTDVSWIPIKMDENTTITESVDGTEKIFTRLFYSEDDFVRFLSSNNLFIINRIKTLLELEYTIETKFEIIQG